MSHEYQEHRAHRHERHRVHHIAGVHEDVRGHHQRARGGHVTHDDEAEDRAVIKKMVKKKALRADGGSVKARSDKTPRRAKGGQVKKRAEGGPTVKPMLPSDMLAEAQRRHDQAVKEGRSSTLTSQLYRIQGEQGRARGGKVHHKGGKTNVNVIVAPGGKGPAAPMMPPAAAGLPPTAAASMPPRPPMAPPPAQGQGAPGVPGLGGMPIRKRGGKVESSHHVKSHGVGEQSGKRVKGSLFGKSNMNKLSTANGDLYGDSHMKGYAHGGSVADKRGVTGIGARTPIQHSGNKSDTQNIGRGPVITKARGGPIFSDGREGHDMGPNLKAGANSGIGRLKKNRMARAEHWEA